MEGNGLSGRMYPNMGAGIPLQTQNPQSNLQNHSPIMGFQQQQQIDQQQTQLSMRQPNYPSFNPNPNSNPNSNPNPNPNPNPNLNPSQNGKIQATQVTNSDEDEPNDQENSSSSSLKRKAENSNNGGSGTIVSPWQRMKWTDNMVRLLIMAVYYIGDEVVGPELGSEKKKPGFGGGGGGAMQKKGKWKSVSRAMMEKGFYVSPQQCEDKFNDLNKRYKRVNDILGKGTACKVVENQTLLETMDLSPKMKEEMKKLLNSKHLFFREMCAYHNSCGHVTTNANGNGNGGGETAVVVGAGEGQAAGQSQPRQVQPPAPQGQVSSCLHSTQLHPSMVQNNNLGNEDEDDDDDDDDEDEDDDDDDAEDHGEGGNARKRARTQLHGGLGLNQLSGEVRGILQDGSKSLREKKQWVMAQMMKLEENGVKYQREALELEKERLKWLKFSSKKEREMEKMKLANERKRLENERMVLLLRKKEIEFMIVEQQQNPAVNPSCISV